MNGLVALLGSGEYLPVMNELDRYLIEQSGKRVVCLPTAAGPEGEASWGRWNRMGETHFRALGAEARGLPIIDKRSANDPQFAPLLENADIIYFSGGNPQYLHETLRETLAWEAAQKAWARGATFAGCSAGAMILALEIPDFRSAGMTSRDAFGVLNTRMILPHFDRWQPWRGMLVSNLRTRLDEDEIALGIDEDTALVGRRGEQWRVVGRQSVSVLRKGRVNKHESGAALTLAL